MKRTYLIEVEEIKTCNGCFFNIDAIDYNGETTGEIRCNLLDVDVTSHMYENTKHEKCPLKHL